MENYFDYYSSITPYLRDMLAALVLTMIYTVVCRMSNSAMVLILVIAHVIGILYFSVYEQYVGLSTDLILNQPRLMEFVFLPPIIFDCTMSLESQDMKKFFWQALILIGPCFTLSFLMLGSCLFPYYYYSLLPEYTMPILTYPQILVSSGYLSTTDPIPVFTILEDLHISGRLSTLLKMESLLGQAVATFFYDMIKSFSDVSTIPEILEGIFALIGCIVVGYIYRRGLGWILGNVLYVDWVAELGMTFAMLYGCYATTFWLQGSGILCIFIFGLTFNTRRGIVS